MLGKHIQIFSIYQINYFQIIFANTKTILTFELSTQWSDGGQVAKMILST